jgi:AP-1 complex subunit gamma-1
LYIALTSDISQESLTLASTWIIGEYSELLLEGGIVDEDSHKQVRAIVLAAALLLTPCR